MVRPGIGVSVLVFRAPDAAQILLVRRRNPPAAGLWAPPGGHLELGERLVDAAAREVREETALAVQVIESAAYPLVEWIEAVEGGGRVTTHYVLVQIGAWCDDAREPVAADDATDCRWWPVRDLPALPDRVPRLAAIASAGQARVLAARGSHHSGS